MATIERFEDLKVRQKSRELCHEIFLLINKDPFCRDFGLVNQIRNSSGSVMDNIAEGFDRGGNKEFTQFLFISKSSSTEVKSQLYRALDSKYITDADFENCYNRADEIAKMIFGLIEYLKKSEIKGKKYK
jgi:four helix bundle protein